MEEILGQLKEINEKLSVAEDEEKITEEIQNTEDNADDQPATQEKKRGRKPKERKDSDATVEEESIQQHQLEEIKE